MSKRAEDAALEAYPDTYTRYRKESDPEGVESGISPFPNTHSLERKCYWKATSRPRKMSGNGLKSILKKRTNEIMLPSIIFWDTLRNTRKK